MVQASGYEFVLCVFGGVGRGRGRGEYLVWLKEIGEGEK